MEQKELISIIVPIYNMSKWLSRCVESLLKQSYANLEIILVDDGSTDDSLEICYKYAKIDSRIVVLHKENGGQGSARNIGLKNAKGEFIGFVDPDDWICHEMYETLLTISKKENADIVECSWNNIDSFGSSISKDNENVIISYTKEEVIDSFLSSFETCKITTSVCSKLFRKTLLGDMRFLEVRAYEDDEFVYRCVWFSKKIVFIGLPLYNYFIRNNSTMTSSFNLNKLALITVQKSICEFFKQNAPQYYKKAQKILFSKQLYILYCLRNTPNIDVQKNIYCSILKEIISNYEDYMSNSYLGRNKIVLFLLKVYPKIAYLLIDLKFKKYPL